MLEKRLLLKTTVFFLWLAVFEIPENNNIVDHLEKCDLFYDFQYGFRSSQLTADVLTVVPDRISRAFNWSGATSAVALDISNVFNRIWHAGLLHILKSYGISVRYLAVFLLFSGTGSLGWFWIGNLLKNIQLMLEFLKGLFLVLHFSYYTFTTFLMML